MADNLNSARRVHTILQTAVALEGKLKAIGAWVKVFEISEKNTHQKNFEVTKYLQQLNEEVSNIEIQMLKTDFSESLYQPYINKIRSAISPHSLESPWNSFKSYLSPDTLLSIRFCTEILPNEEDEINQEEL